ncbi:MFS transporter [Cupriavidus metallidurans]|uniref:MFS transporter n=1 Tax=Cupriavidus metallidurans (strain ATCC 43123 / DSM 2839 / NBRC 102507 / CH34) TaxID=266264 RepID=Q1LNG3_CUPMC|nr:MFS transporter [Cupriavidus metallidurans]ABF08313.1 putative MFS transporter [Cupriavidus metallidurans CH34]QGS30708.1 MFS transporter [Cupriavidus metallidurans]
MQTSPAPTLGRAGLYVLLAGQLLPQIDFSIVNVALHPIEHSLGATPSELELMVAVYGVAFAVFLAMGGRLGDNYGRRRIFNIGVLLFGVASLLCGVAGSMLSLLIARTLQGAAAALLVPQILATIHVGLRGHAHSRALALFASIGGIAFIIGQVLGGLLVDADIDGLGWRNAFLINLPICLAILVLSPRVIPETRRENATGIDAPGTVLLAAVILAILLPIALGPMFRWSWPVLAVLAATAPLMLLLWYIELRQERRGVHPLLPPSLLRLPSVRFGFIVAVLFYACWSGLMFVLALTLQSGAGMTPTMAGNAFIPLGLAFIAGSLTSPRVVNGWGRTRVLIVGCVTQMAGVVVLAYVLRQAWPHPDILTLAPPSLLIGFGNALVVGCFYRIGLADIPTDQAGAGSAALATVQQASLGLGSALLGTVFAQRLHHAATYLDAALASLAAELCLMTILVAAALVYHNRHGQPAITACASPQSS